MSRIKVTVSDLTQTRINPEDHVVVKLIVAGKAMRPMDVRKSEIPDLLEVAFPARKRTKPLTDEAV